MNHIVVFGAGAIGSLYAAKLASRHPVTIIGRADHVDAIARNGLRVIGCEQLTVRVAAATAIDAIQPDTLVVLTTKVNDNAAAAAALADKVRDDTLILCVQNGLHGEEIVKAAVGRRCRVLRAITQFGAIFREPGVVDYKVRGYTLIEQSPASGVLAELFTACGLDGRLTDTIKVDVWRKLVFNCVINPITSIIGSDVGAIADPRLDPLKRLVIDECLRVARADGVEFDIDFIQSIASIFGASPNVASMRQDLLKRKPTEIDHMNGAVVAFGERFGIDCPVNRALVAIIKAFETQNLRQKS